MPSGVRLASYIARIVPRVKWGRHAQKACKVVNGGWQLVLWKPFMKL